MDEDRDGSVVPDRAEDAAADREAALRKREDRVDEHETRAALRRRDADEILAAADDRDRDADARDRVAFERESAASLRAFLQDEDLDGSAPQARRDAAVDRSHAKEDRSEGASDRARLAGRAPEDVRAADHDGDPPQDL